MSLAVGPKVLLICGNRSQEALLSKALEEGGFQVVESARGENVTALLASTNPQIVVLDWDLPDMSATAVTRLIRADSRFRRTPVVLTGRSIGTDDKILSLEVGADLCLEGTIAAKELSARLRALLRRIKMREN